MIKEIALQKEYATTIYDQLKECCDRVILAGGAPRDWFYNKLAKDLDFYVYSQNDWVYLDDGKLIAEPLEYSNTEYAYEALPGGTKMINYQSPHSNSPCQIFFLPDLKTLVNYVPHEFDLSISQIQYNFHNKGTSLPEYVYTSNFSITYETGVIFPTRLGLYGNTYSPEHQIGFEKYIEKIKSKYPYNHFGTAYDALYELWDIHDNQPYQY